MPHYKPGCGGETFFKGWEHLDEDEDEKKPLSGVTPNSRVNYHEGKAIYISGPNIGQNLDNKNVFFYSVCCRQAAPNSKQHKTILVQEDMDAANLP